MRNAIKTAATGAAIIADDNECQLSRSGFDPSSRRRTGLGDRRAKGAMGRLRLLRAVALALRS